MLCQEIVVENFRNIEAARVAFSPNTNLLLGDNAQGKTNLLEAISMLALGKSFRGARDAETVRFGTEKATLEMVYHDNVREQKLKMSIIPGKRRKIEQNGLAVAGMAEVVGGFRVVLFTPEHLSLIKSGPELRRNYLDIALSQLRPMYLSSLQKYNKILKERNRLIKEAADSVAGRKVLEDTIGIWSAQLAHEAAILARYRAKYVAQLNQSAAVVFADMTDGREVPSFRYVGSSGQPEEAYLDVAATEEMYLRLLNTAHDREIGAGFTLWGIHRDDIEIGLNGACARVYASQGQQRSLALAMKLAEGEISHACFGDYPVFLFDDVLSELDSHRRDYLTGKIRDRQVIMTTCEPEETARLTDAKVTHVKNGEFI